MSLAKATLIDQRVENMNLNERAAKLCKLLSAYKTENESGSTIYDLGVNKNGGIEAGLLLARICMSDLATVSLQSCSEFNGIEIGVSTDQPLKACMASQYAGWAINVNKYFAMGSGPMRAARGDEAVLKAHGLSEKSEVVVGVLETGEIPNEEVCKHIAENCKVDASNVVLVVAPTRSIAGSVQIVARSLETAIHKLDELKFDLSRLVSGFGTAPMPPIAKDDLTAIGWTNDSILYGGRVCLWVDCDDDEIQRVGKQVPSNSSKDHGRSFREIFESYDRDFYKIDPMLFSPAKITFFNIRTGKTYKFGTTEPEILKESFDSSRAKP